MHPSQHCAWVCRWRASRSRARSPRMHHASYPVSVRRPACFALSFLPTPPRDDAVALWLTFGSAYTWYWDFHPAGFVPCTAHTFELSRPSQQSWRGSAAANGYVAHGQVIHASDLGLRVLHITQETTTPPSRACPFAVLLGVVPLGLALHKKVLRSAVPVLVVFEGDQRQRWMKNNVSSVVAGYEVSLGKQHQARLHKLVEVDPNSGHVLKRHNVGAEGTRPAGRAKR